MSRLMRRICIVFCLLIASMLHAQATTLLYLNLDDLVNLSDGIVIGKVDQINSVAGIDNNIYTFVTLTQLDAIKGQVAGDRLILRFAGGQIGPLTDHIAGSPRFSPDERVLLFIRGNGEYLIPLAGWTQGVFRIEINPSTQQKIVLDHERNRLLGIAGADLVKETRTRFSAEIVGKPDSTLQQRTSPGRDVNEPRDISSTPTPNNISGISLDQFLSDIRIRLKQSATYRLDPPKLLKNAAMPVAPLVQKDSRPVGAMDNSQPLSLPQNAGSPRLPLYTPPVP